MNKETLTQIGQSSAEQTVHQTLELARRLRAENGGNLDDSAILAVSEALGVPEEYVRTVATLDAQRGKQSLLDQMRSSFMSLRPEVRRIVGSGLLATTCGLLHALAIVATHLSRTTGFSNLGPLFDFAKIVFGCFAVYNVAVSKDMRTAGIAGGVFGLFALSVASVIQGLFRYSALPIEMGIVLGGVCAGISVGIFALVEQNRKAFGLRDAVEERQELLKQLVDIQDRLKSGEQEISFVSVDIAGSTKMKESADQLSVEYTFGEYHNFIDLVTRRYGGRVHSTAGDGVTCAFDTPQQALSASRNMQVGLIELNTHRNKIGVPIRIRVGVHSGKVIAPDAADIKTINFASVIDIAAHIQKICPVGGVAVSEAAAAGIPGGLKAIGDQQVSVDGVNAFIWMPRSLSLPMQEAPKPA